MRSPFILVTVLVVASLFTAVTTTVADQPDDIPLIGFDFDNGFSTNQTTVITGSIEDEVKPASVTWSIVASEPYLVELDSGNFSGILEEADSSGSRPIWTWSLEIDVAEYSPCTCYLTVTVETTSEGITQSNRVLFLGDTSRSAIIVNSPEPGDWVHESISVSGWSMYPMTWTTPELRLFAKPASSSIDACSVEADSDMSAHLSIIIPDGEFSESLDISGLADGWHSLYAENYDPSGVTYSQECIPIQVNNLAPSISIEGPDHSLEGASDLFFDASATDDPVWGREELHYM